MPDHREQLLAGLGAELIGRDNATAQRAVIGHVQTGAQRWQTDQPDREQVLAVESEAPESREVVEEVVTQVLGLVDDEDRDDAVHASEFADLAFELAPQGVATELRSEAKLGGEVAVDGGRGGSGVTKVDDAMLGRG